MDKALIINEIMKLYNFKKYSEFADFLGISSSLLSNWIKRNSFDIELLFSKCEKISANYILTGKGEMLRNSVINSFQNVEQAKYVVVLEKNILLQEKNTELREKLQKCDTEKKILQDNRTIVL